MTESIIKELTTPQLLDHAVVLIDTITILSKSGKYPDLLAEKKQELILVNKEVNSRKDMSL